MNQEEAGRLARELKIDITQVVREEWEVKLLALLFEQPLGNRLYFKGGTALRLVYGSPRFSEDLDFTATQPITQKMFTAFIESVAASYPQTRVSDLKAKFYTLLAEFKISESFLPSNFSMKIEVSTRRQRYQPTLALVNSPTTNMQVLARVERLEDVYQEKQVALGSRRKPRDLFDLWYIAQQLRRPLPVDLPKLPRREIRQELLRYLPASFAPVVAQLEKTYGA